MISKIEYSITCLAEKIYQTIENKNFEANPYLIDRVENILDRCLCGYLKIQNLEEIEAINVWMYWAKKIQSPHFKKTYVSIDTLIGKASKIFFVYFRTFQPTDISNFSIDVLKEWLSSEDPIWKWIILNILMHGDKEDFAELIEILPDAYWVSLKDGKFSPKIIDSLQKIIDLDGIFKCIHLGRLEILRFFHHHGIDIDVKDQDGQSVLAIMAISEQNREIFEFIIAEGFPLNVCWPKSPLSELWQGNLEKVSHHHFLRIDLLCVDYLYNENPRLTEILIKSLLEKKLINDQHLGRMIAIGLTKIIKNTSISKGEFYLNPTCAPYIALE